MVRVIHTCVVLDIETGETLEDERYLYDGEVAECGGGGGGETNTVDYDYNARMATIAEEQNEWAREYFDMWKNNGFKEYEIQQVQENLKALPLESKAYQSGLKNLNSTFANLRETNADQQRVLNKLYDAAENGVNINERMGLAMGDVANSWKGQTDALNRSLARMGVNPNSGRYMGTRVADSAARAAQMAGARTQARVAAEDENFQRLGKAASITPGTLNTAQTLMQGIQLLKS